MHMARFIPCFLICLLIVTSGFGSLPVYADEGISRKKLEDIQAYLVKEFETAGFPGGAYAVVEGGKLVAAEGIGYAELKGKREATPETVYAAASIAKALTATAVLKLVEEGRIELDKPVVYYLPWFLYKDKQESDRVTIRHLLTHSAGVSRYSADGAIYRDIDKNRNSLEGAARELRWVSMNSAAGERGQYCNTCFNLLGLVIEGVTGQAYEAYMEQHLFKPMGMNHTAYHPERITGAPIAKEYGYLFGFRKEMPPYWEMFGTSQAPEGGVYSNVLDLGKFLSAVMGYSGDPFMASGKLRSYTQNGVIASDLSDSMYTEAGFEASELHGTRILSKSGEGMGSSSDLFIMPEREIGVVLLIGESNGERRSRISEGIASILLGKQGESVAGVPNYLRILGIISLGFVAISLALIILMWISAVRHRKHGFQVKRRWAVTVRLCFYGILSVPFWFLLLKIRPSEAGFYGYPYDFAIAMIALSTTFSLWALYSVVLLWFSGKGKTKRRGVM